MTTADETRDATTEVVHGTVSGAQRHRKNHEPVCEDCLRGAAEYMADWRRRTRGVAAYHWPLTLPATLADAPALGAVLAQAWRA